MCQGAAAFAPGLQEARAAKARAIEGLIAQAVFADESRDQGASPWEQSGATENAPEASPRRAKGVSASEDD